LHELQNLAATVLHTYSLIDRNSVTADEAQVAIFDATNSTEERREKLVSKSFRTAANRLHQGSLTVAKVTSEPNMTLTALVLCRKTAFTTSGSTCTLRAYAMTLKCWNRTTATK